MQDKKNTLLGYPIIVFGTDASLLNPESDASLRMQTYAQYHTRIYVVISAQDSVGRNVVKISDKISVYPSKSRNKALALCGMYLRARILMREHGVRCIMSQDPFMLGLISYFLTRNGRGVFAVGIYGTDTSNRFFRNESLKHRAYTIISHLVLPRATAIQTDGPETVSRLTTLYGKKVFFKPMVPANIADMESIMRKNPGEQLKVLFMGRFVRQKNMPLLLEVIASAVRRFKNTIEFTIVGTGPQYEWFKKRVVSRGLSGVCALPGSVSRDRVIKLIAEHDVLLMVSRYEGFPRVFMEAAAAGMPICTTDVGGIKDLVVEGESGFVFSQAISADAVADCLGRFLENPSLLLSFSVNIKKRWNQKYGGKTVLYYQRPLVEFLGKKLMCLSK